MKSQATVEVLLLAFAVVTGWLACGCVERIARIQTDPPGAFVVVNDEEVGISPVRFSFLWYGDYDIMARKPGYQTLKTHYRIDAPWYQWPGFDLVTEVMLPTMIHDQHVLPTFELQPAQTTPTEELVDHATELRDRALFEAE